MGRIWSEEIIPHVVEVEATASESGRRGIVRLAARAIRAYGEVDVAVSRRSSGSEHDVIAFTTAMAEKIGRNRDGCTTGSRRMTW